jgi:RNA polymerase sigma-70 factor (family 1)
MFFQELHYEELRSLSERIATGDQQSFRQLFDLYSPRLINFARSIVRTNEGAIEAVDDVFIKLWKQKDRVTSVIDLKSYLYKSVKNTALNYLSKMAREQTTEPFDHIDILLCKDQNPAQRMITAEMMAGIHAAVESLPPRCKMVFKLVREDGLRYSEVARILNISVDTVDAQMVIAVKRIREKIRPHLDLRSLMSLKKKS